MAFAIRNSQFVRTDPGASGRGVHAVICHLSSVICHLSSVFCSPRYPREPCTPRLAIAVLFLLLASCDSGTSTPTTADPNIPSTTTTIENDTCGRLAVDAARYLESVIEVLDQSTLAETRDRELWQEGLVALEQQGWIWMRATAMRCDPGQVQAAAFFAADLDPDSDLGATCSRCSASTDSAPSDNVWRAQDAAGSPCASPTCPGGELEQSRSVPIDQPQRSSRRSGNSCRGKVTGVGEHLGEDLRFAAARHEKHRRLSLGRAVPQWR